MTSTPPNPSDPPPAEVVHNVLSSLLSWPSVLLLLGLMFVPLALKAVSNLSYGRAYHARPEPSPHAARSDKTDVEPERASRQAHADQITRVWADAKRVHQQVLDEVTAWEFDLEDRLFLRPLLADVNDPLTARWIEAREAMNLAMPDSQPRDLAACERALEAAQAARAM